MFELFCIFLKLGLTSFGGPVAHIGFFEKEFVEKRGWLTVSEYSELVALCHFLPGPASSQVGMAIGYQRGGLLGSVMAFLGFTLPSMLLMIGLALLLLKSLPVQLMIAVHGLKLLAVVVVADAVLGMAKKINGSVEIGLMISVAVMLLILDLPFAHLAILICAGMFGYFFFQRSSDCVSLKQSKYLSRFYQYVLAFLLFLGLVGLPVLSRFMPELYWVGSLFRVGATVMGGGHVVLPMLQQESAIIGSLSADDFLVGYSFAQALPGPLFTLASYIGVLVGGSLGGLIATLAIFLPGWLILLLVLPRWQRFKQSKAITGFVAGVQVGVVGLLAASLYEFVWLQSVTSKTDVAILLLLWWLIVIAKKSVVFGILAAVGLSFLFA